MSGMQYSESLLRIAGITRQLEHFSSVQAIGNDICFTEYTPKIMK